MRLVDADALFETLLSLRKTAIEHGVPYTNSGITLAIYEVRSAPTIDAVPCEELQARIREIYNNMVKDGYLTRNDEVSE